MKEKRISLFIIVSLCLAVALLVSGCQVNLLKLKLGPRSCTSDKVGWVRCSDDNLKIETCMEGGVWYAPDNTSVNDCAIANKVCNSSIGNVATNENVGCISGCIYESKGYLEGEMKCSDDNTVAGRCEGGNVVIENCESQNKLCNDGACSSCLDYDGGENYTTKGRVRWYVEGFNQFSESNDTCRQTLEGDNSYSGRYLIENTCQGGDPLGTAVSAVVKECDCKDGACIEPPYHELIPGHNDKSSNRINMVFINVGFDDIELFKEKVETLTDFYSANQNQLGLIGGVGYDKGIFGVEPFKSNKDQFNIWYVPEKIADVDNEALFLNKIFSFNENYNLNNVERVFVVNNKDYSGSNFVQGGPTGAISASREQMFPTAALHEFIHTAFKIGDEYPYRARFTSEDGYPANWKIIYPPEIVPDNFDVANIFEQCYYTPDITRIINDIRDEQGVIQLYYDTYYPTDAGIEDCERNAPWRDLIGNGCGQDGVVDCTIESGNPDYPYEVKCSMSKDISIEDMACHGFGNLMKATPESIMADMNPKLGPFLERLVCRRIRSRTGSVSGICDSLCIDGCASGERCISGNCV